MLVIMKKNQYYNGIVNDIYDTNSNKTILKKKFLQNIAPLDLNAFKNINYHILTVYCNCYDTTYY